MSLVVAKPMSVVKAAPKRKTWYRRKKTFMTKSVKFKRYNGLETKTFYFNISGVVNTNIGNTYQQNFRVNDFTLLPPPPGAAAVFTLYDSYKIMGLSIRCYPANVGVEPDTVLFGDSAFLRGNAIVWSDNYNATDAVPTTNQIAERINYGSCRMLNPRRAFRRYLKRPPGNNEWRSTGTTNPPVNPEQDQWKGYVCLFGEGNTPSSVGPPIVDRPLWFFKLTYKVVVRGRSQE